MLHAYILAARYWNVYGAIYPQKRPLETAGTTPALYTRK